MALIEWPEFEDKDKAPDITDASAILDYLYYSTYLDIFDNNDIFSKYFNYNWAPSSKNVVYLGSDFAPLTNTGSVKFSNPTDSSLLMVTAKATGAYLDPDFDASSAYYGAGTTSLSINLTARNQANKIKLTASETVNNSFNHREGYTEDTSASSSVFKDGLDTKDKTDDVVSRLASSKYDLSSEIETEAQATSVEKHIDTLDVFYNAAAGTTKEVYQTLRIANEYAHVEKEYSNGRSSISEFKREEFSSVDKDISSNFSQSKDVSYTYSLNEATDADGYIVSSESEDSSFKISYSDKYITNASLSHVESYASKINDNTGLEVNSFSDSFSIDYADTGMEDKSGAHKFSVALLEKSDEVLHESGNLDSTVEILDLSKFNYSDSINSFAFNVKEVNISRTNGSGDYLDDVYKLNMNVALKTADYSITAKEITQLTLENFNYYEESQLHTAIARVTDYIEQLKNVEEQTDTEENASLFSDVAAVEFADFEGVFEYVSLLSDNTVKVLNQRGFEAFAGRGNDTVIGNIGADILHGGTGNDILTGGAGADLFVFETALDAKTNVDAIKDFSSSQGDKILLDNLIFTGSKEFNVARLASAAAVSANTLAGVIYDNVSGKLYYNADGLAGQTTAFATLASQPLLAASDVDFYAGPVL